jgi:ORF6N domain
MVAPMPTLLKPSIVPSALISQKIFFLRGTRIMLDADLAQLYGVATKNLNKAVKRNANRFPSDFMFRLSSKEMRNLRFQIVTSRGAHGGRRYAPYAFTEQGVAMLSSVLRSSRAVQVNVAIYENFRADPQDAGDSRRVAAKSERNGKAVRQQISGSVCRNSADVGNTDSAKESNRIPRKT